MTEIIYGSYHAYQMRKEGVQKTLDRWQERGYRFTATDNGETITLNLCEGPLLDLAIRHYSSNGQIPEVSPAVR